MKPKKSTFKVKAKKTERSSGGGVKYLTLPNGISAVKFEEGVKIAKLDILPYIVKDKNHPDKDGDMAAKGELWYRRPFKVHKGIGVGTAKKDYVCLQSVGKRCPICEYQKELFNTDKEAAVALYPKDRDLYAVKLQGSDEIQVWDMSQKLFHDVLVDELETDDSNEDFADLESGKTLKLKLLWKEFGKITYPEVRSVSFEERDEVYDEDILDEVPCLDECFKVLSYEELKDAFFEMGDEPAEDGDDDEEEDEKPARKPKSTKPEPKKSAPAKPAREDESELDWETLKAASFRRLGKLIKEVDLFIDTDDYDEDDEDSVEMLRKDIAKELGIEIPKKSPRPEKGEEKTRSRSDNKAVRSAKVEDEDDEEEDMPKKSTSKASPKSSTKPSSAKPKKVEDDDDDDDKSPFKDDEDEETSKTTKAKKEVRDEKVSKASKGEKAEKNRCPHGHKFGTDFEKTEDCDSCTMWDDCFENRKK